MQFDESTPRRDITVQSVVFSCIQPYAATAGAKGILIDGQLNEGEAHTLNQTVAENARNNFRDLVDEAIEKGDQQKSSRAIDALQAEFDEYLKTYDFGKRAGGLRAVDPVVAAMKDLARKIVRKRLRDKGEKLSEYSTEQINTMADEVIDRFHDQLRAKAEAAVAAEQSLLSDLS